MLTFEAFIISIAIGLVKSLPAINPNDPKNYIQKQEFEALSGNVSAKISTDLNEIICYLWNKDDIDFPYEFKLDVNPKLLRKQGFDPQIQTKLLVHGWNSDCLEFSRPFVKAYFSNVNMSSVNIISIDWSALASWDNYFVAASNSIRVGKLAGQVLGVEILIKALGQDPLDIHAIGHSAGAHLAGQFGRAITDESVNKIGRITALDPAKPWFDMPPESNKISRDDAIMVDVIHTNSGQLFEGCLSMMEPLGHIDFYPNGGSHQPGCTCVCVIGICMESNMMDIFSGSCSHSRATLYFLESIGAAPNGNLFLGTPCKNWKDYKTRANCESPLPMGESLTYNQVKMLINSTTTIYLDTMDSSPFAMEVNNHRTQNLPEELSD